MLILLACVAFMETGAQGFFDDTDMMELVKSILIDPEFIVLEEQEQIRVLREIYKFLDNYYAYIKKKHIINFM